MRDPEVPIDAEAQLSLPGIELHHPLGRANDRAAIPLDLATHRWFSDRQWDWPQRTLKNPAHCPRLRRAAALRAWLDIGRYFAECIVLPKVRALEAAGA